MGGESTQKVLRELLLTTKDGDWGKDSPAPDLVPYRVIRGTDFPAVRVGDISSVPVRYLNRATVERRTLAPNDILLETAGGSPGRPTGRSVLISDLLLGSFDLPATCASFARFLRVDPSKAVPEYVYWHLQYLYASGQMEEHQVQHTGVARFQYTKFANSEPIPLPRHDIQRAIAHILGTLDDKIELNRRMNRTLEAMARALFKSWFVDFDPVRPEERDRDAGLPGPASGLFSDSFEESALGRIPAGWAVGCVDDDFDLTMGQSPPGETYNEDGHGHPFYQGRSDFGVRFPKRRIYCSAPTRYAKPGDTLISVRAPVGDVNMATELCAIGRGVAAARHKTGSRSYTYQFMKNLKDVFARFEGEGTVFGSIGKRDFHAITCVRPPSRVVVAFEHVIRPFDDRIEINESESNALAALRDTLLPKLISGELRVKDAEKIAARAL